LLADVLCHRSQFETSQDFHPCKPICGSCQFTQLLTYRRLISTTDIPWNIFGPFLLIAIGAVVLVQGLMKQN
jgi:hypothetical protein